MKTLKLIEIGKSTGVILTNKMLTRLKLEEGDTLYAIETRHGYLLTPNDPATIEQIAAGRKFMERYDAAFKKLAK